MGSHQLTCGRKPSRYLAETVNGKNHHPSLDGVTSPVAGSSFFFAPENLDRLGPDRVCLSVDRQRQLSQLGSSCRQRGRR